MRVNLLADGIYSNVRQDDRLCLLVVIGVTEHGRKELIAVEDGVVLRVGMGRPFEEAPFHPMPNGGTFTLWLKSERCILTRCFSRFGSVFNVRQTKLSTSSGLYAGSEAQSYENVR